MDDGALLQYMMLKASYVLYILIVFLFPRSMIHEIYLKNFYTNPVNSAVCISMCGVLFAKI